MVTNATKLINTDIITSENTQEEKDCVICRINKKNANRAKKGNIFALSVKHIRHTLNDYKKYHPVLYFTASVLCQQWGYACPTWRTQVLNWHIKLDFLTLAKENSTSLV